MSPEVSQRSTLREDVFKKESEAEESETPTVESDSEGLVMAPRPSKRKQKTESKQVIMSLNNFISSINGNLS